MRGHYNVSIDLPSCRQMGSEMKKSSEILTLTVPGKVQILHFEL